MVVVEGQGHGGPGIFLLSPAIEGNGLMEERRDPVGQHLVAQVELTRELWLLRPWNPLQGLMTARNN